MRPAPRSFWRGRWLCLRCGAVFCVVLGSAQATRPQHASTRLRRFAGRKARCSTIGCPWFSAELIQRTARAAHLLQATWFRAELIPRARRSARTSFRAPGSAQAWLSPQPVRARNRAERGAGLGAEPVRARSLACERACSGAAIPVDPLHSEPTARRKSAAQPVWAKVGGSLPFDKPGF